MLEFFKIFIIFFIFPSFVFLFSVLCTFFLFYFLGHLHTFIPFIYFFFFRVTPVAYGSFQARGGNGAAAHSHSDTGSELCLLPTLQPTAAKDP